MGDVAYLTTLRVPPQNAYQTDTAMLGLFYALAEEEFGSGGVETFAIHRVPGDEGAYQIYEQYTADGDKRHLQGPQSQKAYQAVLARMIDPGERSRLEPLGMWGVEKAVGGDIAGDEAWRFTVRVAPQDVAAVEDVFRRIMTAMAHDEFPTGDVKSYTAFRYPHDVGRYVMYEHFTSHGSKVHATGEELPGVGADLMALLITPFERQQLEPIVAFGTNNDFSKQKKTAAAKKPAASKS